MNQRTTSLLYLLAMITYGQHVKPILDSRCVECHSKGNILNLSSFPFTFKTVDDQKVIVDMILGKVQGNPPLMPPGNRPKLTANQVSVIEQWRYEGLQP